MSRRKTSERAGPSWEQERNGITRRWVKRKRSAAYRARRAIRRSMRELFVERGSR